MTCFYIQLSENYVPPTEWVLGGGGEGVSIVFAADPVSVHVRVHVALFPCVIF